MFFVLFKLQDWETLHSYTLVDDLALIHPNLILATKEVPDKKYTVQQLEALRSELLEGVEDDN